jgi:hypothetical protein
MGAIGVRLLHCGSVGLDANNGAIATSRANSRSPPFARFDTAEADWDRAHVPVSPK